MILIILKHYIHVIHLNIFQMLENKIDYKIQYCMHIKENFKSYIQMHMFITANIYNLQSST